VPGQICITTYHYCTPYGWRFSCSAFRSELCASNRFIVLVLSLGKWNLKALPGTKMNSLFTQTNTRVEMNAGSVNIRK